MTKKAIKANVKGRIQGVGYRASTHQKATRLGIKGYVKSSSGSEIEVVAEGEEEKIEELIQYLQEGPNKAEVEDFSYDWIEPTEDFIRFAIKYEV
ncbi:acylphosphatase [Natroniella sulfidigena]|uniref:acylphosphatase n=1 Tax=Natroniella sulfidigena TaxID=723921 RepID=UPI00200B63D5|nr:acylphosphatase [Natroniella sulfidigena]MCK8817672.1 acylphosphatase [Natroniella sulfidigena]